MRQHCRISDSRISAAVGVGQNGRPPGGSGSTNDYAPKCAVCQETACSALVVAQKCVPGRLRHIRNAMMNRIAVHIIAGGRLDRPMLSRRSIRVFFHQAAAPWAVQSRTFGATKVEQDQRKQTYIAAPKTDPFAHARLRQASLRAPAATRSLYGNEYRPCPARLSLPCLANSSQTAVGY